MPLTRFAQLRCRGTHHEMGIVQGKWLRPRFDEISVTLLEEPIVPSWIRFLGPQIFKVLLTIKGVSVVQNHLENMRRVAPYQVERMVGMAEGAGWRPELLFGLGSVETRSAHFQYIMGCTSLGVSPSRSKSSKAFLAYNHDFPASFRDHLFIRYSRPDKGFNSVQLTYPALPGCIAGVNSKGVAISLNHAFTTEPFNHGVPPTFMVQEALDQCANADEVLELFQNTTFSCGSIATVVDERGGIYAMELSRERFGLRVPKNGISQTFNEYQVDYMKEIEVPEGARFHPCKYPKYFHDIQILGASRARRKRFDLLMKRSALFSKRDLKRILADHAGAKRGGIGTICRHHETTDTIATVVISPKERMMEAGRGHACFAWHQQFKVP